MWYFIEVEIPGFSLVAVYVYSDTHDIGYVIKQVVEYTENIHPVNFHDSSKYTVTCRPMSESSMKNLMNNMIMFEILA